MHANLNDLRRAVKEIDPRASLAVENGSLLITVDDYNKIDRVLALVESAGWTLRRLRNGDPVHYYVGSGRNERHRFIAV